MRQCAPDNHILDLVVICMLSPLCMLLLHVALLLFWLCTATYSHSSRNPLHYSSDQGHPGYPHLKGLWSWPPPWTPYHPWAVMGSLCEREHEQMGQRMRLWTREGARLGRGACARCKRYWKGAQAWASSLRESSISCTEVCFVSSLFSLHFIFTNILFRYYGWQPSSHLNSTYFDYHLPTFQPNSTSFQPCHTENDPLHHPLLQQWMVGVQTWTVQEAWVWGVPTQTEGAWGVNVDGSRGVGTRGANTDWGSMGRECGWFKGHGCKVFTLLLKFSQFTKRTGTRYISMVFFKWQEWVL